MILFNWNKQLVFVLVLMVVLVFFLLFFQNKKKKSQGLYFSPESGSDSGSSNSSGSDDNSGKGPRKWLMILLLVLSLSFFLGFWVFIFYVNYKCGSQLSDDFHIYDSNELNNSITIIDVDDSEVPFGLDEVVSSDSTEGFVDIGFSESEKPLAVDFDDDDVE